ncbi:TadE family type IV pilus minor pilin [Bifidobacterium gallicum]|uniref:Pilus biosynthesis protein TadE n=1 Tax=Bifidobacterium gallicum DSM 20093 = LMG 11596 TaxID=561180 RepID=D1NVX5_9BIFI|nr:TadE family type IV pilus minor pilin [Bifidobacterium gallicum]EFA22261.1 TadE-like protein [Bifidobacterium gallicum DSM 20093 = LMG 11596]KFI59995.1 pilus biosynthesis protein TadE [Bifidobacterium gallicum DSM 20093 = LMG 11596]
MLREWFNAHDDGAATAEFACVLPVVVVLAVSLLYVARASVVSLSCQDAAASAARALVVEGDDAQGRAVMAARQAAGDDVRVTVGASTGGTQVTVSCAVVPDPLGVLPTRVQGKAVAVKEP